MSPNQLVPPSKCKKNNIHPKTVAATSPVTTPTTPSLMPKANPFTPTTAPSANPKPSSLLMANPLDSNGSLSHNKPTKAQIKENGTLSPKGFVQHSNLSAPSLMTPLPFTKALLNADEELSSFRPSKIVNQRKTNVRSQRDMRSENNLNTVPRMIPFDQESDGSMEKDDHKDKTDGRAAFYTNNHDDENDVLSSSQCSGRMDLGFTKSCEGNIINRKTKGKGEEEGKKHGPSTCKRQKRDKDNVRSDLITTGENGDNDFNDNDSLGSANGNSDDHDAFDNINNNISNNKNNININLNNNNNDDEDDDDDDDEIKTLKFVLQKALQKKRNRAQEQQAALLNALHRDSEVEINALATAAAAEGKSLISTAKGRVTKFRMKMEGKFREIEELSGKFQKDVMHLWGEYQEIVKEMTIAQKQFKSEVEKFKSGVKRKAEEVGEKTELKLKEAEERLATLHSEAGKVPGFARVLRNAFKEM